MATCIQLNLSTSARRGGAVGAGSPDEDLFERPTNRGSDFGSMTEAQQEPGGWSPGGGRVVARSLLRGRLRQRL